MFIGLDHNRVNIIFNLIFSGLILLVGLLALGFYHHLLNNDDQCGYFPMTMLSANTGVMLICTLTNICLLLNNKFDPRIRKKIKSCINGIRFISFIWHIVFFSISIHNGLAFNTSCQAINNLVGIYLTGFTLLIGLEFIFLVLVCIMLLILLIILLIMVCCCGYEISAEDETENDAGTPYFSRTTVDTFKNLLSLGLFGTKLEEEREELNCPICLEDYLEEDILRKMPCDHFYHQECIDQWLKNNSLCPVCKQNIRDGESKFDQTIEEIV